MSDLVIKVKGDAKDYNDKIKGIKDDTDGLEIPFKKIAAIGAAAFAAITAEMGFALKAYGDSELATNNLTQALQNQGIYSDELINSYKKMGDAIQEKTGIDNDAITAGQTLLQGFIGQRKITPELTALMADLSSKTGSVETAAKMLGQAFNGQTKGLKQYGVQIQENLTYEENFNEVMKQSTIAFGGQAEASAKGLGSVKRLGAAFEDFQKTIGEKLAPFFTAMVEDTITFFNEIQKNKAAVEGFAAMGRFIYEGWRAIFPRMWAALETFFSHSGAVFRSFGELVKSIFTFDRSKITEAFNKYIDANKAFYEEYSKNEEKHQDQLTTVVKQGGKKQNAAKKEIADQRAALINQEHAAENAQVEEFRNKILTGERAYMELSLNERRLFLEQHGNELRKSLLTEEQAKLEFANREIAETIKRRNKMKLDAAEHGEAIAKIAEVTGSREVQAFDKSSSNLIRLQNSKNATLKAVGKAAAISNITISTAQSAVDIIKGFTAAIPIFGFPLGVAAAAAMIAYGAEQIGDVLAANKGGVVPGVGNVDSIPAMLTPGELVVPAQNFDEVINAVSSSRSGSGNGAAGGYAHVILELRGELMDFIETKLVERSRLGISIQGAT